MRMTSLNLAPCHPISLVPWLPFPKLLTLVFLDPPGHLHYNLANVAKKPEEPKEEAPPPTTSEPRMQRQAHLEWSTHMTFT